MKNKNILFIVLLLILVSGIGFSYYHFNKQIPVTEIKDSLFSQFLNDKKEKFTESEEWYDVSIEYPKDNQKIRDIIFEQWNAFAKESKLKDFKTFAEAKEELQLNVEGMKYSFNSEYSLATSTDTISYVYQIYTFTGGAHGGTDIFPITLNQKLEILTPENILPDDKLKKVSEIAYKDIIRQKKERLKEYGMSDKEINENLQDSTWVKEGTDPKRENYSSVWFDGGDLVISFGQYQVGSYAEGIYEVRIPKTELR